jgi:hypothetical protein
LRLLASSSLPIHFSLSYHSTFIFWAINCSDRK